MRITSLYYAKLCRLTKNWAGDRARQAAGPCRMVGALRARFCCKWPLHRAADEAGVRTQLDGKARGGSRGGGLLLTPSADCRCCFLSPRHRFLKGFD